MTKAELTQLRTAVADYLASEGCSCCRDIDQHEQHRKRLGDLLLVESEAGWHDFRKYRTAAGKEVKP